MKGDIELKNIFARTKMLLGNEAMASLANSRVAVFGVGGVGGYVVEGLCRAGVGHITVVDDDEVAETNLNRQIIATSLSIGQKKTDEAEKRIKSINPACVVKKINLFFLPENADTFDFTEYDYIVDAIDTVSGKIALIEKAKKEGTKIISCMGTGNKLDPTACKVADISKTAVCPLAKVMRRELKKRGIEHVKVVYSEEKPTLFSGESDEKRATGRPVPGSVSFVPPVAGFIMAGEVVKDIIKAKGE